MKHFYPPVLAILLCLTICFGGMIMLPMPVANAAISSNESALSLEAAKEGMVLLENKNNALPLANGDRTVALFGGAGAMRTATAGTGAETSYPGYTVSVYQGLKNAGFTITSENWLKAYDTEYEAGFSQWEYTPWDHFNLPEPAIDQSVITEAAADADTAIYVIRRIAGEGNDRKVEKGDYLLSDNEMANLTAISRTFDKVIVLLNTCGPIDVSFM
ncbi:MAG: glycoside hydrolase family 3 C-terminal domain-containing protein, partial [Clostridia bacterium]|nr:glycoside hydrolase family 3 C-terminal domain-containing protein [Clostridia bacterium]